MMGYLSYTKLDSETQEGLISMSKKEVEIRFGKQLKSYAQHHCANYDKLLEEQTIRNLYNYYFVFKM
ncbi:hypothetical protein [Zunongwangia mangrovi]|nr:hypothetical protein [Zunongwangia mangrovi]